MSFERYRDDAKVGDECVGPAFTVTVEHILTYANLTGDLTPVEQSHG